jgi:hypothetical protein
MKRTREVFVAIRHAKARDVFIGAYETRSEAMYQAERAADQAANDYGFGSASAYRAKLVIRGAALRDKASR